MRIRRGVGVLVLVVGTMVIVTSMSRVPEALAGVELFRVKKVELEGARFLTLDEVKELLDVTAEASVWDDLEPLGLRVRRHGLVAEADVRRRLPGTLVVRVREREPVALLPTPVLSPVDREGRVLPIDPARHRLDLPVVHPLREVQREEEPLRRSEIRLLAGEVATLAQTDPGLLGSVSELAVDSGGDIALRMTDPDVTLHYRPPLRAGHIREGLRVLSDAAQRHPDRTPRVVDLRYADQVVVRFQPLNRR
jgi:cell division protein FtsQ